MENTLNTKQKITQKLTAGTVSATFGIVLILASVLFAGWYVYGKYRDEGVIRPLFGEKAPLVVREVIYEDLREEEVIVNMVEE